MNIQVKTFNGHTLWDTDYHATLLNAGTLPVSKPVFVDESQADSVYSGMFTRDQRNLALQVRIVNYVDRELLRAQLLSWLKPGTRGTLVATFAADGQDYQLAAVVQNGPVSTGDQLFTCILQSEQTAWRAVTADFEGWTVTGTSATKSITVEGDDETALSMTLTPSVQAPDGYKYSQLYRIVVPDGIPAGTRPWCITIDHAALVTAGKSLESGDDLRIWRDDREARRWIADANTDHTKIWYIANLRRGASLVLQTAVAATGVPAWLVFVKNAANQAKIRLMPNEGIVYENNEWFYYSGRDAVNCRLQVETRGLYDTTEEAHHAGDTFYFIPEAIRVLYGKATATDPTLEDDDYNSNKPLFNLSSSDNTQWVWTATDLFVDLDYPGRPGRWVRNLIKAGDTSELYWIAQNAESGNAAMGVQIGSWLKAGDWNQSGTWMAANAIGVWTLNDPLGLKTITVTGQKWRNSARWPSPGCQVQRSPNGVNWFTVFTEATPASASTWTNFTNNSSAKSLAAGTKKVRLIFRKTFPALADALALAEIQTATVAFTDANIPTGTLLGEGANYQLDITIENTTTGDSIELKLPMRTGKALVLNGEALTAKYNGANAHNAIDLDDEGRTVWLPLEPGTNSLSITGPDMGTLTADLSWYRRRL